jgi:hypothetical protein
MIELTQDIVRELLDYDPEMGALTWKRRDRRWFSSDGIWKSWNSQHAGKLAFTAYDTSGYLSGLILGRAYKAHRIIFLWVTGRWPDPEVDHDNHIRDDNRWVNLLEKTHRRNRRW